MTKEDRVYADWLNLLGSELYEPPEIAAALHKMYDKAEKSHGTEEDDG